MAIDQADNLFTFQLLSFKLFIRSLQIKISFICSQHMKMLIYVGFISENAIFMHFMFSYQIYPDLYDGP